jgi:hypothetical protein
MTAFLDEPLFLGIDSDLVPSLILTGLLPTRWTPAVGVVSLARLLPPDFITEVAVFLFLQLHRNTLVDALSLGPCGKASST